MNLLYRSPVVAKIRLCANVVSKCALNVELSGTKELVITRGLVFSESGVGYVVMLGHVLLVKLKLKKARDART